MYSRRIRIVFTFFFGTLALCFFFSTTLYAKPLDEILTYSDFVALVQNAVGKVPDLEPYWSSNYDNPDTKTNEKANVYFGGSGLRNLLHWLYGKLQTHSVAEVRAMTPPPLKDIQLHKASDRDLIVPDDSVFRIQSRPELQNGYWDFLGEKFMRDSAEAGGTTLEKLRINPWTIVNPHDSLEDYYHGRLRFNRGKVNIRTLTGNTELTQALRFLRILQDLPEAAATEDSIRAIQKIGEGKVDIKFWGRAHIEYWIEKAIFRLLISHKSNIESMIENLRDSNLLTTVASEGFTINFDPANHDVAEEMITHRDRHHLSMKEMLDIAETVGVTKDDKLRLAELCRSQSLSDDEEARVTVRVKRIKTMAASRYARRSISKFVRPVAGNGQEPEGKLFGVPMTPRCMEIFVMMK